MASNPFDPKLGGLFGFGALPVDANSHPKSAPADQTTLSQIARLLAEGTSRKSALPVSSPAARTLIELLQPTPTLPSVQRNPFGPLGLAPFEPQPRPVVPAGPLDWLIAPPASRASATPKPTIPSAKRRAFFSFHYDDNMRVNVVRNAWKITHPSSETMRSFQDSSMWEARKLTNENAIKNLIRYGVNHTSAVCVLVGSETWSRRWVRYEIARAVVDERGLLAVHLNSIRHHKTRTAHTCGPNPLSFMAVGKIQTDPSKPARHYLYEKKAQPDGWGGYVWAWHRYSDYTDPVKLPRWVDDPPVGFVTPLSDNADEYDYIADQGHQHIGGWIDRAAKRAGR